MTTRGCNIEGCEKPHDARGWCNVHYRRWKRTGDPLGMKINRGDPAGSLSSHSERRGGCIVWTGGKASDGYGIVTTNNKSMGAHRLAYLLHYGEIPKGMQIDHICHNRVCIEPAHLRLATPNENQRNRSGSRSATGHRNVYPAKGGGYYVQIRHGGRKISFGSYSNLADAAEAARRGRIELFGDFAGRG